MAEVKLAAGAKFDVLNRKELHEVLRTVTQDWFSQVSRGDRYKRFHASAAVDAIDSSVEIGGSGQPDSGLGPAPGFVWAVNRVGIGGLDSGDVVSLFINDSGPASLVRPGIDGYADFSSGQLVLYPGDVLMVTGTTLGATGDITVTGQARELPLPLAWRLGG